MLYKNNRGFTLIELLVVIAIIGILSSVVLASLNTARQKSRDVARISDMRQIQLAFELYFDSCGQYPPEGTGEVLPVLTEATGCPSGTTFGSFVPTVPVPPTGGTTAVYEYDRTSTTAYCLGVDLENAGAVPQTDRDCDADGAGSSNPYTTADNVWFSVGP